MESILTSQCLLVTSTARWVFRSRHTLPDYQVRSPKLSRDLALCQPIERERRREKHQSSAGEISCELVVLRKIVERDKSSGTNKRVPCTNLILQSHKQGNRRILWLCAVSGAGITLHLISRKRERRTRKWNPRL